MGNPDQHHEPDLALHQRGDLRFIALAEDQIILPEAGHGAILGLGRELADGDHAIALSPGLGRLGRADPPRAAGAQRQRQLRAQLNHVLAKTASDKSFGGHAHIQIIRVLFDKSTADLLR